MNKLNLEDFKNKGCKVHNNFYIYDLIVEYAGVNSKYNFICPHTWNLLSAWKCSFKRYKMSKM